MFEKMEKSMGPLTNEKVSDHIPDDLAFSILSKLPLKSLKRFSCVRKSWSLLFESSHFMSMYRKKFISNNHEDDSRLLLQTLPYYPYRHVLYLLSGERFHNRVKLDWPPLFQEDDRNIFILGSVVNGIVCLYQGCACVVLWNPATEEFKVLPHSPTESSVPYEIAKFHFHGFGYDHVRDDYKVIRHVTYCLSLTDFEGDMEDYPVDLSRDPMWEIYSQRNNSWRKCDVDMPLGYRNSVGVQACINGVCHWWDEDELVSFNLTNEVFFTTPLPSDVDGSFDFGLSILGGIGVRHLVVLNESIALISNYAMATTTFHISILGELGVKESWTKLFIVGPLPCVEHPIGAGKKGDIFFRKKDDDLVWYDLSTQKIEELGIKGQLICCQIVIYKESFLPIGA